MKPFWGFVSGLVIGIVFTTFYFLYKRKSKATGNPAVKVIITAGKPVEKE